MVVVLIVQSLVDSNDKFDFPRVDLPFCTICVGSAKKFVVVYNNNK